MSNDKSWLLRHALYMASNLPDDPDDARAVLRILNELVDNFFEEPNSSSTVRTLK
jgi:hypothetical protein